MNAYTLSIKKSPDIIRANLHYLPLVLPEAVLGAGGLGLPGPRTLAGGWGFGTGFGICTPVFTNDLTVGLPTGFLS
jgi:hypothetical protein